ncbi:TPA: hypothetical protein RUX41_000789 [Aeromonas dhakensis]|nr:hypothetical protein [Aeromonas dhakensis]
MTVLIQGLPWSRLPYGFLNGFILFINFSSGHHVPYPLLFIIGDAQTVSICPSLMGRAGIIFSVGEGVDKLNKQGGKPPYLGFQPTC